MPATEAQMRASMKYRAKTKEQMNIDVPKGMKAIYKEQAAKNNMSLSAYIIHLLEKNSVEKDPQ